MRHTTPPPVFTHVHTSLVLLSAVCRIQRKPDLCALCIAAGVDCGACVLCSYYTHYRCQKQSTAPLATTSAPPATPCSAARGRDGLSWGSQPLEGSPFDLARPDPALCAARCNSTSGCAVWVYHAPGCSGHGEQFGACSATGAHGCCFLKAKEEGSSQRTNPCSCGGIKGGGALPLPPGPPAPGPNPDPHALVCSGVSADAAYASRARGGGVGGGSVAPQPMWNALDFRNGSASEKLAPACNTSYEDYSAFVLADEASRIASLHATSQSNHSSLFMYLAFQSVHEPMQAPQDLVDSYVDIATYDRRVLAAMVTAMDSGVGRAVDGWKKAGLWDDTVLMWTTVRDDRW